MIKVFARLPNGVVEISDRVDAAIKLHEDGCSLVWIDLENPDESDIRALAGPFDMEGDSVEDCLEGKQRPRVDEFDNHAFFLLYGAVGPESEPEFRPRKLSAFLGTNYLVTVHEDALKTINELHARIERRSGRILDRGAENLLFMIVDAMVDNYLVVADQHDERLDLLEELSNDPDPDPSILSDALALRREMLELRRITASQREVLQPLVAGELDFISENISGQFLHVRDHLTTTIETIDNLREILNGVRDNYNAALATRANSTMQTLTIFASIFLPLSLVAGIYGMNVPLWPPLPQAYGFWFVLGFMALIAVSMLIYFRIRRWL